MDTMIHVKVILAMKATRVAMKIVGLIDIMAIVDAAEAIVEEEAATDILLKIWVQIIWEARLALIH
jgi:hypothetical protein